MDIAYPSWLLAGLLLTVLGLTIWRWSSRHNTERKVAAANVEAALNALKGGKAETREHQRERVKDSSRLDIARFAGVAGFLILMSGLLLMALGLFAP